MSCECWSDEDKAALLAFKDAIDSDDIKIKEQIKNVLLNNRFIIHALNNRELEEAEAEPDDYYYENILPYYLIPTVQTETRNFVCFEVGYKNLDNYNSNVKLLQITFHILCHQEDIRDEDTGIARHDLLAALIQDQFDHSTYFGSRVKLVSDQPSTTDTDYAARTLIFEQITDNNLVKSNNRGITSIPKNTPRLANKDIQIIGQN